MTNKYNSKYKYNSYQIMFIVRIIIIIIITILSPL